jgi:retron-type reverse transcriptase
MPKRHNHLYEKIISIDNLREAYNKTAKGKKNTVGYLRFKENKEANLYHIQQELIHQTYKIGPFRNFTIYEPKERLISAASFRDRLVQHALCNIISPIFEATLLPYTFACRVNKGTHAGVKYIQSIIRKNPEYNYFLKTDYSKFFPSIDRQKLHLLIERKIKCKETLWLLQQIIPNTGNGIPIGSLTSQLFANVYGGIIDHYLHYALKVKHWARYMDDIVIFGKTLEELKIIKQKIVNYSLQEMNMSLSKYTINSLQKGINFLGYRIWRTHKLIRKSSVIRAKRKIKKYIINKDTEQLNLFLAAWLGHIKWANCYNLINHLGDYYETYYQY